MMKTNLLLSLRMRPQWCPVAILLATTLAGCAAPAVNAPANEAVSAAPVTDATVSTTSTVAAIPASVPASAPEPTRVEPSAAPLVFPGAVPPPVGLSPPAASAVAAATSATASAVGTATLSATTADRGSAVVAPKEVIGFYPGTGQFVKPTTPPVTPPKGGEETFNLNFEAQDIRTLVQSILGDYLHETFTIHPGVMGNATIRTSQPVAKRDLIPMLEMLLRDNGQVMVREEGIYKIRPQTVSTRGTLSPQLASTTALPNGYSVQMVQLKFVGAKDMQRILEPYAIDPMVSVRLDEPRNLIILSGTQREIKHLLEIIDIFDIDFLAGYSVGLFPMQTDVKSLSGDLDRLFGAGGQGPGASTSPLAGIVRIIPIERMNGLLVVSTQPRYLEEAKKWIERLDKAGGLAGGMRLNVYPVQNGKADKLAQLLTDVYGNRTGSSASPSLAPGQRPAQIATPGSPVVPAPFNPLQALASVFQSSGVGVAQNTRIIADIDNNALLILSSPSDFETIQSALRQLDVQRRQVRVEVVIAEVALKDELKYGIEWFINTRNNTTGSLRANGGTLPVTNILGTAVSPITEGLQLINLAGNGNIRAVLQALGDDNKSTIIFTPNITVLDNEKASINVGTKVSVSTGETVTTGGTTVNSTAYLDTGVILAVTPRINAGGRVTLEINQEVSTAIATTPKTNPNISTRKAQTVVNVASGETIALAGLISKDTGFGTRGVPLLSKIPVIGGLFGVQSYTNNRTELVLLITPVVITNDDDARAVTNELRKKLPLLQTLIPVEKPSK